MKDKRGFTVFGNFTDVYGSKVTIKMSSSVKKRGWIFVKWNGTTGANDGAIHFTNAQAKKMIRLLEKFLTHD